MRLLMGQKCPVGQKCPMRVVWFNSLEIHKIQDNGFFTGHLCLIVRKRTFGGLFEKWKNIIFLFQEISMDKSLVAVLVRLFWPGTC